MADPTKYQPGFDYSAFEQANPTVPKPGGQLDNDFQNIAQSVDETIDALKDIRRSDGQLNNEIVTVDSLSDTVKAMIAAGGAVDIVGENIDKVITVADNIGSVNTVATNITNVNKVATIDAAVTAVAGIEDEVVDLAAVAPSIPAVAGVADEIPTVAGVAGDIPAVAGVADGIPTVAANLADIHNFADVYQGAKAVPPTTRNDGSPLLAGDLYFDTNSDTMRTYTGAEWRDTTAMSLNMVPNSFVSDGVATTFTLSVEPAIAANVLVWVNNVRLRPITDYTVSGTTLTIPGVAGQTVPVDTLVVATISRLYAPADGTVTLNSLAPDVEASLGAAPQNMFLGAFTPTGFITTGSEDLRVSFYTSPDGGRFERLNVTGMKYGPDQLSLAGPCPSPIYKDGWWLVAVRVNVLDSYDFTIYRSRDLMTWGKVECIMGSTPNYSATIPMPGGSVPADHLWAPELRILEDGNLYVFCSIRYGNDFVDIWGNNTKHFQSYFSRCTDIDTLAFEEPTRVNYGGSTTIAYIDPCPQYLADSGTYAILVKNEYDKQIRCFTAASLTAQFNEAYIVDTPFAAEAPCLTQKAYLAQDGTRVEKWLLYVDAFVEGRTYVMTADDLLVDDWSVPVQTHVANPIRHGSVVNLAFLPEAEAAMSGFRNAALAYLGYPGETYRGRQDLVNGVQNLVPQEGWLYRVTAGNVATINIVTTQAQFFYLTVASGDNAAGIILPHGGNFNAANGVSQRLGFGRSKEAIYKVVLNGGNTLKYTIEGLAPVYMGCGVHKNGVPQTMPANGVSTKITFGTEEWDIGGIWDAANSRLTGVTGKVRIRAQVNINVGLQDAAEFNLNIRKNGSANMGSSTTKSASGTGGLTCVVEKEIGVVAADYTEIWGEFYSTGTTSIMGEPNWTHLSITVLDP